MTYAFSLGDFIYKIIISVISRFIFKELEPYFNPKPDYKFYDASFGAAVLLLLSTAMFITSGLLACIAFLYGFTPVKFVIVFMFIPIAVAFFREHQKIVNKYNKKRQF